MSDADLKRLKAQQDANAAAIARMQMHMQAQSARVPQGDDEEEAPPAPAPKPAAGPQYQQVDQNQLVLQAITNQAARSATAAVKAELANTNDADAKIKARMKRLVEDFPALQEDDSPLVVKSRDVYARIEHENPTLDKATKYELAVREAASIVGARPLSVNPVENQDWTMGSGRNPALPARQTRSRLTTAIIQNAQLMGINCDPKSPEGQKNLAELSEYSARFNADVDESQYRYQ